MDSDGYPEEEDILRVKNLGSEFREGAETMLDLFEASRIGSGAFQDDGSLVLHTGGWSGNEELIGAAMESFWWMRFWHSTTRGGHYVFKAD